MQNLNGSSRGFLLIWTTRAATIFRFAALLSLFAVPSVFTYGQSGKVKTETSQTTLTLLDLAKPLTEIWKYTTEMTVDKLTASDNELRYVSQTLKDSKNSKELSGFFAATVDGVLSFISYSENGLIWSSDLGGEIVSTPAEDDGSVYIVIKNREDSTLKSLNKTTGIAKWQIKLDLTKDGDGLRAIEEIYVQAFFDRLFVITGGGSYFAIQKEDGSVVWSLSNAGKLTSAPFFTKDRIVAGAVGGKIIEISPADGTISRRLTAEKAVTVLNETEDGKLVLGSGSGLIYSVDAASGLKLWSNKYGAEITHITLTRFGLMIVSADNFVRMLSVSGGKQIWKRKISGRLSARPLVSGNFGVFASLGKPEANILELKTGKIVNRVSLSDETSLVNGISLNDHLLVFLTAGGLVGYSDNHSIKKQE